MLPSELNASRKKSQDSKMQSRPQASPLRAARVWGHGALPVLGPSGAVARWQPAETHPPLAGAFTAPGSAPLPQKKEEISAPAFQEETVCRDLKRDVLAPGARLSLSMGCDCWVLSCCLEIGVFCWHWCTKVLYFLQVHETPSSFKAVYSNNLTCWDVLWIAYLGALCSVLL